MALLQVKKITKIESTNFMKKKLKFGIKIYKTFGLLLSLIIKTR